MGRRTEIGPEHRCAGRRLAAQIYKNPEKGYCEETATRLFAEALEGLGLTVERNIARTGCTARICFNEEGPRIAVLAELDAIKCKVHPASGQDGYAHCCGHNLQVAAVFMLASKLVEWKKEGGLCGSVDIIGVPSEEYIDLGLKEDLKKRGEISFFGGKQELIRKGYFDQVDIAMVTHNMPESYMQGREVVVGGTGIGFFAKRAEFTGREAHAGLHPERGVNALQAMVIALNNINALRDTFSSRDETKVHYIITNGGETINIVPGYSALEMHVRGRDLEKLDEMSVRLNNCFQAASMAIGCDLTITEMPGYLPGVAYPNINQLCAEVGGRLTGGQVGFGSVSGGASDFGDLTQLLTTLKIATGGITGSLHGKDFKLVDFESACVLPAEVLGGTIYELLRNHGEQGRRIIAENTHKLTKEAYLQLLERYSRTLQYHYMTVKMVQDSAL